MENKKTTPTENNVKVNYQTEHVNLQDYGYEKSGAAQGDPDVYASYLNRILNGDLVIENHKGLTVEEKNEKRDKVKDLQKVVEEKTKENEKIEVEIKDKEKKIDERRNELLHIREKHANDNESLKRESFSPLKFGINLFILIMLTVYLFFFYVSAAYKALYVDLEKISANIASGIGTGSIMPGPYELSEALQYNYLLFLVPFVFYAFGWAFHILLEMKQNIKFLFIGLLIAVTFTVDFLLALIIHNNTESAKELMGLSTVNWGQSTTFYIILFLGFLVYIIWSILLDSLLREWSKRNITQNLRKIIKHHRRDITELQKKLFPVGAVKSEIDQLKEEINTFVYGNLKGYIDQFSTGWVSYLTPQNMKDVKQKCLNLKKEFEDKNNIRPGKVKVVKK